MNALKAIKVPNVRYSGGCFADEYHWCKDIGKKRDVTLSPNWCGVNEPNTFGIHEYMDFLEQIGSGKSQEAAEWFEYLTTDQETDFAKQRAVNGHPAPTVCECQTSRR